VTGSLKDKRKACYLSGQEKRGVGHRRREATQGGITQDNATGRSTKEEKLHCTEGHLLLNDDRDV